MNRETERLNREMHEDLVMIGEIVKPHGIRGEVKAFLFSGQPGNFRQYKNIVLQEPEGGRTETHNVVKSREQGKLVILQLENIGTREEAEALQGNRVWLHKADLPPLDTDEFYWHQINNLQVVTETGLELGRVTKLFSTAAHDIMVVAGGGQEFMIPVKGDIIREIDEQGGKIVISPPPGLLEINR